MRYHRPNPTIYYLIGAVAAGAFALWGAVSVTRSAVSSWQARKAAETAPTAVVSSAVESEPEEETEPWMILLVNKDHKIPTGYTRKIDFVKLRGDVWVDERMYPSLQQMMDDCRAAGYHPIVISGFRTIAYQDELFETEVRKYVRLGYPENGAILEAEKLQQHPGYSEHHLALAVDILPESNQYPTQDQENSDEIKWLMAHCQEYGFILRYPVDKESLTGINYEPWHYRYVGTKAAKYIMKHKLCLEEYVTMLEEETAQTASDGTAETTAAIEADG